MLGMMVSSILKFAKELGSRHVVKGHAEKRRTQVLEQSTTDEDQYRRVQMPQLLRGQETQHSVISAPTQVHKISSGFDVNGTRFSKVARQRPIKKHLARLKRAGSRKPKCQLLKEEKDRFNAMRAIEDSTHKFKRYSALAMSALACEFHAFDTMTALI